MIVITKRIHHEPNTANNRSVAVAREATKKRSTAISTYAKNQALKTRPVAIMIVASSGNRTGDTRGENGTASFFTRLNQKMKSLELEPKVSACSRVARN